MTTEKVDRNGKPIFGMVELDRSLSELKGFSAHLSITKSGRWCFVSD